MEKKDYMVFYYYKSRGGHDLQITDGVNPETETDGW